MAVKLLLCVCAIFVLTSCEPKRNLNHVVLSYAEDQSICEWCPHFRVEVRSDGGVNLVGQSGCAVPGDYYYRIPEADFRTLLREFDQSLFFSTPRINTREFVTDAGSRRLRYSDDVKIHEVIDVGRTTPAISHLEKNFRKITQVDYYLKPSVNLYRELTQSGWNVNAVGDDHENALVTAVSVRDAASVAFLLEHGATVSDQAFQRAASYGSIEIFNRLVSAKKLDYHSEEGGRLLMMAVGSGNQTLVRDLLDRGAPVNYHQPQTGETALLATDPGHTEISRLLIEHGADVNARDSKGQTTLFRAASGNNTGLIELLAARGANPDIADNGGQTALMRASGLCCYWNIKALLAVGANPKLPDHQGQTALAPHYAAPHDPKCAIGRQLLQEAIARSN